MNSTRTSSTDSSLGHNQAHAFAIPWLRAPYYIPVVASGPSRNDTREPILSNHNYRSPSSTAIQNHQQTSLYCTPHAQSPTAWSSQNLSSTTTEGRLPGRVDENSRSSLKRRASDEDIGPSRKQARTATPVCGIDSYFFVSLCSLRTFSLVRFRDVATELSQEICLHT